MGSTNGNGTGANHSAATQDGATREDLTASEFFASGIAFQFQTNYDDRVGSADCFLLSGSPF